MSRSSLLLPALLSIGLAASHAAEAAKPTLAVCADPTNLPYSDDQHPGFENRIADLLAADLHADTAYTWQRSYRSFLRRTLFAGACDVVIGVPATLPGVAVTRPYYASSYVAVMRADDKRHFESFDDPWLPEARIGVQLIGADHSDTPPTTSLALRQINRHITGFAMRTSGPAVNPQGLIIDAVAAGTIDVAFVWGPIAGYFAKPHGTALRLTKITTDPKHPDITFVYPMAVATRTADTALRDRMQAALDRHQAEIAAILGDYGVPTVPLGEQHAALPAAVPATIVAQSGASPGPAH